jgi:hypothetical protein
MLASNPKAAIGWSLDLGRAQAPCQTRPDQNSPLLAVLGSPQGPEGSRVAPQARSASQPVTGQGKIGCPRDGRQVLESLQVRPVLPQTSGNGHVGATRDSRFVLAVASEPVTVSNTDTARTRSRRRPRRMLVVRREVCLDLCSAGNVRNAPLV